MPQFLSAPLIRDEAVAAGSERQTRVAERAPMWLIALLPVSDAVTIRHIFVSPGHNYFGRYGGPSGTHPIHDVSAVKCRAGWGIEGDRFYGYRPDYKGQVTFFAWETFAAVRKKFDVPALSPSAFRRNVVIEGLELNRLIGRRFTIDGIEFEGTAEARPCHWMNQAVAPGAEDWLMGQGGLRTRVLTDGELRTGPVDVRLQAGEANGQMLFTAPSLNDY